MNEDYSGLLYAPPPEKPKDFDERFNRIVRINPATNEPWLRIVWGMDRKKVIGGVEEIWYIDPNGKYVGMPYLILEKWAPPDVYDRTEWEERRYDGVTDILGPFPENGVWDFVKTLRYDDMRAAGWEMGIELAQEAVYNATQPNAVRRGIDALMLANTRRKEKQAQFEKEHQAEIRNEIFEELLKGDPDPEYSFPVYTKKELRDARKRESNRDASGGILPSSSVTTTPSGLIVKRSALEGN